MPVIFDDGGPDPIRVALINEAKTALNCSLADLTAAFQVLVDRDLGPGWGLPQGGVKVEEASQITPGVWPLILLDDSDQEDALGYHDVTAEGNPIGKAFIKTSLGDDAIPSVIVAHEFMEFLIDPACNGCYQNSDGRFYAAEVADPVQDQTYEIDGIPVSNWVYPAWFQPFRRGSTSVKFDYLGNLTAPFSLSRGGYALTSSDKGWTQVFGSEEARYKFTLTRSRKRRPYLRNTLSTKGLAWT